MRHIFNKLNLLFMIWTFAGFTLQSGAVTLVKKETIDLQTKLTKEYTLKNGIPLIVREVPDSDIIQLHITFNQGLKDFPVGHKIVNRWLWPVMTKAAGGYPKEKVFDLTEKYALEIGCEGGIEISWCSFGTINEYWNEVLPLFAAIVKTPSFKTEDINLVKNQIELDLKSTPEEPENYINEIVNEVYYPEGHPYRLNYQEGLKELSSLSGGILRSYHQKILSAPLINIVVTSSLPPQKIIDDMEKYFSMIPRTKSESVTVKTPTFVKEKSYRFEHSAIPTAYIRAKFPAPSIFDRDQMAAKVLFEILSEELDIEVRTKRSLSYAVYSFIIQYSTGIGIIGVSTSKPKETLDTIEAVVHKLKTHDYSPQELEEYKHIFATNYFLTQETHASLASAIASSMAYFKTPKNTYTMPERLAKVTPADIKRLARKTLKNMRLGVLFDRTKFKDEWAKEFIDDLQTKN